MTAVPSLLSENTSQLGRGPSRLNLAVGLPVVVTLNMPSVPTVNVVSVALVITGASRTGGAACTTRVKVCIASGSVPFVAVIVSWYVPTLPVTGTPCRMAVPVPVAAKLTPGGKFPVKLKVALGTLGIVDIVNEFEAFTTKVALFTLVIVGGGLITSKVNVCTAAGEVPLDLSLIHISEPTRPY